MGDPGYRSGGKFPRLQSERGVALITVLLFFAFLSAIAIRLGVNHSLLIAQSHNAFASDLALTYALGAEDMARQVLYEDFTQSGKTSDHLQEAWARPLAPLAVDEGGLVEIQIHDRNNCFNLNALATENPEPVKLSAINLMEALSLPGGIVDRISDWVDTDDIANGFGAEDNEYLLADPPHRTPNTSMGDVSELELLHGQDDDPMQILARHVCVLPATTLSLNVNTADGDALASLVSGIDVQRVRALVAGERNFQSVADFLQANPEFAPAAAYLAVVSEYFQVDTRVQIDETVTIMSSLVRRDTSTGLVKVLVRDFGQDFRSRIALTGPDSGTDGSTRQ